MDRTLAWSLLALSLCACAPEAPTGDEASAADVISQEKTRGPVTVTSRVEPRSPSFADRIHYSLEVRAPSGVEVMLPPSGEGLTSPEGQLDPRKFIIRDHEESDSGIGESGERTRNERYVLEVVTSGDFAIPSRTVAFVDRRNASVDGKVDEVPGGVGANGESPGPAAPDRDEAGTTPRVFKIVTDEIPFTVRGLDDTAALEDLAGIEGPEAPPRIPPSLKWPLIALGGVVGLVVVALLGKRLLRRAVKPPPAVPPEDLAYRELEWLLAQRFTDRGELREFYFHLSRIVREFIERRFGLRAPEHTTEEFLAELARSDALASEHKRLLGSFLEKADLVKFARYQPSSDEITASFDAAKAFIGEARRRPGEAQHGPR